MVDESEVVFVAWAHDIEMALDRLADEADIAYEIEQFVTSGLVGKGLIGGIEEAVAHLEAIDRLIEGDGEFLTHLVAEVSIDIDEGIVEVATLDEIGLEQRFHLVEEAEGATRRYLSLIVGEAGEFGLLTTDDRVAEINGATHLEIVGGNHLVGAGAEGCLDRLGELDVAALGIESGDARLADLLDPWECAAVEDRHLGAVEFDNGIVDMEAMEGRHEMLESGDLGAILGKHSAASTIIAIDSEGRDGDLRAHISADYDDAGISLGRLYLAADHETGMKSTASQCEGGI